MAKPEYRKARKDYPANGIAKGDQYWYVQIKTGPRSSRVMRQKEPFKRSQLTGSEYLSTLYDWEDSLGALDSMENAQMLADEIRELGEEQTAKKENMPDHLQDGEVGQQLEARATACEAAAEAIESVISDWEEAKEEHERDAAQVESAQSALEEAENGEEAEEAHEELLQIEDPGDFDEDQFLDQVKEVSVDE